MNDHQIMELVVLSKDCTINLAMKMWLDRWHITPHVRHDKHNIAIARNAAVDEFLERDTEATHLIFMDGRIWPGPSADLILSSPGDVIYLGYTNTDGEIAHVGNGLVGASCARYSRAALLAIDPPWFEFGVDAKGCNQVTCECTNISNKLIVAGFMPIMVGVVPHAVEMLAVPNENGHGIRLITKAKFLEAYYEANTK